MNKPPLGTAPYYCVAINRIDELSQAIYRYSQELNSTGLIKRWASEIILQCELIERMKESEELQENG